MRYLAAVLAFSFELGTASAEPMPPVSYIEACKSYSVVTAKYLGWTPQRGTPVDYFNPPLARFQIASVHLGAAVSGEILVRYDFDDGSPCVEPPGWKFSETMLPSQDAYIILFLESKTQDFYSTYRGDFGRMDLGQRGLAMIDLCKYVNECSVPKDKFIR